MGSERLGCNLGVTNNLQCVRDNDLPLNLPIMLVKSHVGLICELRSEIDNTFIQKYMYIIVHRCNYMGYTIEIPDIIQPEWFDGLNALHIIMCQTIGPVFFLKPVLQISC